MWDIPWLESFWSDSKYGFLELLQVIPKSYLLGLNESFRLAANWICSTISTLNAQSKNPDWGKVLPIFKFVAVCKKLWSTEFGRHSDKKPFCKNLKFPPHPSNIRGWYKSCKIYLHDLFSLYVPFNVIKDGHPHNRTRAHTKAKRFSIWDPDIFIANSVGALV